MNIDLLDLTKRFREMSDDELLSRCSSGTLNEIAQPIAIEELASRGLELPNPISTSSESGEYEGDFVTVAQFLNPTDAHIVCSCLEAAGVPAFVADANLVQMNSLWAVAVGGVRVRVPATRVTEAKEVIDAFNRGDFALSDDGESHQE
jgi:Putative prokaryotic signal transducing protein